MNFTADSFREAYFKEQKEKVDEEILLELGY